MVIMPVNVYLDTSVYNRPFDDQSQPRIWLETLAVSIILQMVEKGSAQLVSSAVVDYEVSRIPNGAKRHWIQQIVQQATMSHRVDESIRQRGQELEQHGLKAVDALHVATAEAAQVACFVTCDDRLIRRYRANPQKPIAVCTPAEFVENYTAE